LELEVLGPGVPPSTEAEIICEEDVKTSNATVVPKINSMFTNRRSVMLLFFILEEKKV
jgi:hypothetical protein